MRPGIPVDKQNNRFDFSGDSQLHHSQTTIAGMVGRKCIGNRVCGDGGLATHALLAYPKVKIMQRKTMSQLEGKLSGKSG